MHADLEVLARIYRLTPDGTDRLRLTAAEIFSNGVEHSPGAGDILTTYLRMGGYLLLGIREDSRRGVPPDVLRFRKPHKIGSGDEPRHFGTTLVREMSDGALYLDPDVSIDVLLYHAVNVADAGMDREAEEFFRRVAPAHNL